MEGHLQNKNNKSLLSYELIYLNLRMDHLGVIIFRVDLWLLSI